MLNKILIALRLRKPEPKRPYPGHVPPRPLPARREVPDSPTELVPAPSWPFIMTPSPEVVVVAQPCEPEPIQSGEGGSYSGAGATGAWEPETPSYTPSCDSSSYDSSSSDSSSCSSD